MKGLPAETDFVVIGAGVAGLRAATELAEAGRVLVLAKRETTRAEGRVAHGSTGDALSDEDEISLHLQDTLDAGDGLCHLDAVKVLIEEAPHRIEEIIAWGMHLNRGGTKLVFGSEGGHGRSRMLHARGSSTRHEILRALHAKTHALKNISTAEFAFSTGLRMSGGRVAGISLINAQGIEEEVACCAVLLATGGMGQLYPTTTNPEAATADGIALALRAGAEVSDMEFVQFHPTALYVKKAPHFLLSDALRGEGAYLRNFEMSRFMGKYHPMGELAPAPVIARAIVHEMEVSRARDPFVYLDLTHLDSAKVQKRFPRIYATCMQHNIDITEDMIPVRPAAHFAVGGVRTDLEGKTSVAGLYAAGEVASTGLHGANRLPSNAVLESLVYGARAGRTMRNELRESKPKRGVEPRAAYSNGPVDPGMEEIIGQVREVMWNEIGIVRTRKGMQDAISQLEDLAPRVTHPHTRRSHEAANVCLAASLVARSALARQESRGSHYRMDYPNRDDKKFLKHSVVRGENLQFE
jgi:L-aspartate oxidase